MKLDFDYAAARADGYSDDDILNGLAKQGKLNFDVKAALKDGHSATEILQTLIGPRVTETPKEPESSSTARRAGDVGISALKGVIAVPEAIVGLADMVSGGAAGRAVESTGVKFRESKELLSDLYSPEQKAANQRVADAKGFVDTAGALLSNPSTLLQTGVESLPSMGAGGIVGRGVAAAGKIAPYLAGAIGEGVVGAGSAAEGTRQQTADGLLDAKQVGAALASGVGTGVFGAIGGRLAKKLGIEDIDTALVQVGAKVNSKGVVRRLIEGGVSEGVFEELPQSVQEQIWQNVAMDKPLLDGVPEQAAQGLLAGGLLGGIAGGVLRGKTNAPDEQPAAPVALLGNTPDPLISFPDGSVGRQSDVDAFINGLPEDDRPAARARLMGLAPQEYTAADVLAAQSVDDAIAVAERAMDESSPIALAQKNAEIDAAWQQYQSMLSGQRDAEFTAAEEARRLADVPAMQEQLADQQVEQAQALTAAQGFDTPAPTAMQLAMQEAQAKRAAAREAAIQRRTVQPTTGDVNGPADVAPPAGAGSNGLDAGNPAASGAVAGADRGGAAANPAPAGDAVPVAAPGSAAAASALGGVATGSQGRDAAADEPAGAGASQPVADVRSAPAAGEVLTQAKAILSAAGVTGNERMAALRAIRTGENTLEDLIDAHPPKETANATPPTTSPAVPGRYPAGDSASAPVQSAAAPGREAVPERADLGSGSAAPAGVPAAGVVRDGTVAAADAPGELTRVSGGQIDDEWTAFARQSGTLNIDRAQMPQVKAEHRGALVQFLGARGISHETTEVPAGDLRPTQREFSSKKVQQARDFQGGDRSILISSDNHVLDGHHQWLAKLDAGEPVKVIRLDAPIRELLAEVHDFPSSQVAEGADPAQQDDAAPRASASSAPASGMSAADVTRAITRLRAKWMGFTRVSVVQSVDDLPTELQSSLFGSRALRGQNTALDSGSVRTESLRDLGITESIGPQGERRIDIPRSLYNNGDQSSQTKRGLKVVSVGTDLDGNISDSDTGIVQGDSRSQVVSGTAFPLVRRPADSQAAMFEGVPDGGPMQTTEMVRNILVARPGFTHLQRLLNVPSQRPLVVMEGVVARGHDLKIVDGVVQAVPVDMMDYLFSGKTTANVRFHNKTVLELPRNALIENVSLPLDVSSSGLSDQISGFGQDATSRKDTNYTRDSSDTLEGFYDPKSHSVYLIADNLSSPERAIWVSAHEILGHGGLRMLQDKGVNEALNLAGANRFVKDLANAIQQDRTDVSGSIAIEEAVAELAAAIETDNMQALTDRYGVQVPATAQNGIRGVVARVLDAVRRFLAAVTGKPAQTVSDADVRALIGEQQAAVEGRQKVPDMAPGAAPAMASERPAEDTPLQSRAAAPGAGEERIPKWAAGLSPAQQAALRKSGAIYTEQTMRQKIDTLKEGALKKLQYGLFDHFAPIKDKLGLVPYIHARLAKAADGTLEALMLYGRPHLDTDGAMLVDTTKKGFIETMQALNGEHDRFFSWLAGRRAEQLKKEGRENLFTDDDISALATLNQGTMKDGTSREAVYLRAQKDVAELNKSVLDIAEESGLIDGESRKVWASDFYVPFYRVMEEGVSGPSVKSGLVNQKSIKKLKGGTNNLGDLTQNMLMNWSTLLTASAKNRAAKASLDVAAGMGIAVDADEATIRAMAKAAQSKAVSYMEEGRNRWFTVEDEHVLAAISALEFNGYNNQAMKAMTWFKNALTRAITASPYFKIRNLQRDSVSVLAVSDSNYNILDNWKQGASLLRDKDAKAQMIASGGIFRFGTYMEGNRGENVKRLVNAGVDESTILNTAEKMAKFTRKWWGRYEELGDFSENLNRAALYKKLRADGKSHLEASFEARDLMDFGLSGAWAGVRALNQILPFFNARLQGIYKLGRAYNDDPKRMGYVIGAVALASIALLLAYKDDDDFKKRTDADRNNYWWFKVGGIAYRIPKPFEIGAAGSAIEHMTALVVDSENTNGERFASQLRELINGQLAMNPIPQVFRPMIDVYANKDAFQGRPIETMAMQRLRPEDRYNANTSELARLLSKSGVFVDPVSLVAGTGAKQLSPVQIDSLIRGYFSGVGTFAVAAVDGLLHHTVIDRGAALPLTLKDYAGSFAETLPSNSSRYVNSLYETAQDIEQSYASYQNAIKQGDIEKARAIMRDEGGTIAKYHLVESLKKNESRINAAIQRTRDSKELTGKQKEEALRRYKVLQDQIARQFATRQ